MKSLLLPGLLDPRDLAGDDAVEPLWQRIESVDEGVERGQDPGSGEAPTGQGAGNIQGARDEGAGGVEEGVGGGVGEAGQEERRGGASRSRSRRCFRVCRRLVLAAAVVVVVVVKGLGDLLPCFNDSCDPFQDDGEVFWVGTAVRGREAAEGGRGEGRAAAERFLDLADDAAVVAAAAVIVSTSTSERRSSSSTPTSRGEAHQRLNGFEPLLDPRSVGEGAREPAP